MAASVFLADVRGEYILDPFFSFFFQKGKGQSTDPPLAERNTLPKLTQASAEFFVFLSRIESSHGTNCEIVRLDFIFRFSVKLERAEARQMTFSVCILCVWLLF